MRRRSRVTESRRARRRAAAAAVAIPTHNRPGAGGTSAALCEHLVAALRRARRRRGRIVDERRARDGSPGAYVYARWGKPRPADQRAHRHRAGRTRGWSRDPCDRAGRRRPAATGSARPTPRARSPRSLVALEREPPDATSRVLFSGDEERGTASVRAFLASPRARGHRARHRVRADRARGRHPRTAACSRIAPSSRGPGGHSSKADYMPQADRRARPARGRARRASARARLDDGPAGMTGPLPERRRAARRRRVQRGPRARPSSLFSLRPPPGFDRAAWDRELAALARAALDPGDRTGRDGDRPRAVRVPRRRRLAAAGRQAARCRSATLDFWTEAALYLAAGIDAVVIGPGDIAQAHAPDE